MNDIADYLEELSTALGRLYGLPGYALVTVFCIVIGWGLRGIKRFPNEAIPFAIILCGMVLNGLIADPRADSFPLRIWLVKNAIVGGICGGFSIGIYRYALKPLAKRFGKRLDNGDTEPPFPKEPK